MEAQAGDRALNILDVHIIGASFNSLLNFDTVSFLPIMIGNKSALYLLTVSYGVSHVDSDCFLWRVSCRF